MRDKLDILSQNILFKHLDRPTIEILLSKIQYSFSDFHKSDTIAFEGDKCSSLGILLAGNLEIQKTYSSGKILTINRLEVGDIFGEVIIFSSMATYPSTLMAIDQCTVMFIPKDSILKLCAENAVILKQFMELLSNKILMLSTRIKSLSYETIRQKISNFLFTQYRKQKNTTLVLSISRQEMADELGIQRPSLSRELIHMRNEGLLDFKKNILVLKDLVAIEDLL
jgi:CRP-like cAMP-binding protein